MLSQYKADSWRFETSRERYARFVRDYPEIARRASVNHIASYLLMTPESLSRVTCRCAVTAEWLSYTAFPSFSKSLRDLLCVTMYTPRNTRAMAIPFSKLNTPKPKMMATVEATMGCM